VRWQAASADRAPCWSSPQREATTKANS